MTTFGPLYHSTLGFDITIRDFERLLTSSKPVAFPPHNIYKDGNNDYYVELAVAGFSENELDITVDNGYLNITGTALGTSEDQVEYIHKGIGTRSFSKKIKLLESLKVKDAVYENGVLRIHLENIIPEQNRPIKIQIGKKESVDKLLSDPSSSQLLNE